MEIIKGGVTAAKGFKAAGMAAGISIRMVRKIWLWFSQKRHVLQHGTFTLNRVFAHQ